MRLRDDEVCVVENAGDHAFDPTRLGQLGKQQQAKDDLEDETRNAGHACLPSR